jgi:heme-degrading monooxygenase HmoA
MSIVKINALEIPPQAGDEIVERFTARLGTLADVAGFLGFELLRPTADTESRWFVYTRWADQASYEAWRDGDGARASHAEQATGRAHGEGDGEGHGEGHGEGAAPRPPVSMGATLLEFEVAIEAGPSGV